jgi:hypothetical protein
MELTWPVWRTTDATTEYVAAGPLPDAAAAMFLTTLTVAIAIFAKAICSAALIKMFAIFLGLLIIFNYIMNVLLLFPALCIYDRQLTTKDKVSCCITCTCCGFFGTKKGAGQQENADNKDNNDANKVLWESTANPVESFQDEESKNPSWIQCIMTAF